MNQQNFPKYELFNLRHQTRKAAASVNLNLAEACTDQTNAELRRFLGYRIRLAIEAISCLFLIKKKKHIEQEQFRCFYDPYKILVKMRTRLRATLT